MKKLYIGMKKKIILHFDSYFLTKTVFAFLYLLFVLIMDLNGFGCIFRTLFGFPCPGCGMTRALSAILKGKIGEAIVCHPMIFSLPVLFLYYWTDGKLFGKTADRIIICTILFGFAVNWISNLIFVF